MPEQVFNVKDKLFVNVCEEYSLTPELLVKIIYFKIRGKNNADIAKEIGVHRVTVQRYLEVMRKMEKEEIKKVVKAVYKIM